MRTALALVGLSSAALLPAQITFHQEIGKKLVPAGAAVERLATGMQFTEGPVWDLLNDRLVFSDIPTQRWMTWTAAAGVKELGPSGGANGNTLDAQLLVLACRHEARDVVRREADGSLTVLVDRHEGKRLNSPNDVAVYRDGTIWFTDPTYGLGRRQREQPGNFVYRFDPARKELRVVLRDLDQPNGLCFAPDRPCLYVADSGRVPRIGAFPVRDDGSLGDAEFWIGDGADGMRCDAQGRLFTAARDGVRIHSAKGVRLVTIACPEQPANLAFGGADLCTLFVTARTSLYRIQVAEPGLLGAFDVPPAKGDAPPSPAPPTPTPEPKPSGQR